MARSRATIEVAVSATSSARRLGLLGPAPRDDDEAALVGDDEVALLDGEPGDTDRLAGGALLQPAPRRGRDRTPRTHRETQLTGLRHVAAHAVSDDSADPAPGRAQAQDAAPARHIGAALVVDDDHALVVQAATGRGGRLNLGAVASAFSWPLPLVLERFHEALPDVEIRTQEIDTHEAAAGLLDRSLDWAIVRQTAPVRGTTATAFFADRFVAALPLHHPAADAIGPLDLADLASGTWVSLHRQISPDSPDTPDCHDAMATMCRAAGFSPVPARRARSVTSQIAMVECGLGVTIVQCGLGVTIVPAAASASRPAVRFRPLRHAAATIELTAMTRANPGALAERLTAMATQLTTAQAPPPHD